MVDKPAAKNRKPISSSPKGWHFYSFNKNFKTIFYADHLFFVYNLNSTMLLSRFCRYSLILDLWRYIFYTNNLNYSVTFNTHFDWQEELISIFLYFTGNMKCIVCTSCNTIDICKWDKIQNPIRTLKYTRAWNIL